MKFAIVILMLLSPQISKANKITELTPSMKKKLDVLGGSLDTESIIALSMMHSDHFKIIEADKYIIPSYKYRALAPHDPKLNLTRQELLLNDLTTMTENTISVSKYFSTGTGIEVGSNSNRLGEFASISISQSLMNDMFGIKSRRSKKIGSLTSEAQLGFYKKSIEDWMLNVIRFYYKAVSSKLKSDSLKENLKNKEKLVKITNIKLNRGTAEEGDLLRAKSTLTSSKIQYNQTQQVMQEFWNELALNIKLEGEWLNIDPNIVPTKTDSMFEKSLELCSKNAPETSLEVKALENQSKAMSLDVKNKKLMFLPNFDLIFQYRQLPIEDMPEDWNIGFRLSYPLPNNAAKAELYTALGREAKTNAQLASLKTNIKRDWLNMCSKLSFLNESVKLKEETLKNYKKIMVLEEKRYSIGRSTILQLIQTGEEQLVANLDLIDSKEELQFTGWEVAKMYDTIQEYLKTIEDKYKKIGNKLESSN